jgi:hypothetical protein
MGLTNEGPVFICSNENWSNGGMVKRELPCSISSDGVPDREGGAGEVEVDKEIAGVE